MRLIAIWRGTAEIQGMRRFPTRFTLRQLLLLVTGVAVLTWASLKTYEKWIIPRTPIHWQLCRPDDLPAIQSSGNAIVVVTGNWMDVGSFGFVARLIEHGDLRKAVHARGVECRFLDVTSEKDHSDFKRMAEELRIPESHVPLVLMFRNQTVTKCEIRGDGDDWRCVLSAIEDR